MGLIELWLSSWAWVQVSRLQWLLDLKPQAVKKWLSCATCWDNRQRLDWIRQLDRHYRLGLSKRFDWLSSVTSALSPVDQLSQYEVALWIRPLLSRKERTLQQRGFLHSWRLKHRHCKQWSSVWLGAYDCNDHWARHSLQAHYRDTRPRLRRRLNNDEDWAYLHAWRNWCER